MRTLKTLAASLLCTAALNASSVINIHYINDANYLCTDVSTEETPLDLRELAWKSEEYEADFEYSDTDRDAPMHERVDNGLRLLALMLDEVNSSGDAWAYLRSLKVNQDESLEITALIVDEGGSWELTARIPLREPTVFICNG